MPARRFVPETFITAFVAAAAAVMASGYLLDAIGLAINPAVLGVVAIAAGGWALVAFREDAPGPPGALALFAILVAGAFGYFLWLTSPSFLPVTIGPDIVHHLQLIHVIHRTHHLVHDAALEPYLLEMMNYTPGSHIAAAVAAGWLRVDPLRVLLPLTALFVAIKVGIVYVVTVRILAAKPGAPLLALSAPALLAIPSAYVLGSFFQFFYYAQVLSETFAMGMAVAALGWYGPAAAHLWLASVGALASFCPGRWLMPPARLYSRPLPAGRRLSGRASLAL